MYIFLFYCNAFFLIPRLYLTGKYVLYFAVMLLLLAGVYFLAPFDRLIRQNSREETRKPPFPEEQHRPPPPPDDERMLPEREAMPREERNAVHIDIVSIVLFITAWSFSSTLPIILRWRNTERRALQAEKDRIHAELSFLKAQINPHFLFNTLNNIYSLAIIKSEQTPDAVMKLSKLLRYVTEDVRDNFIPLQQEVEAVTNYIELQELRLTSTVDIQFTVKGALEGKQIAPLVFMSFIENAFKYGISNHEASVITIAIDASSEAIHFICRNKMVTKPHEESTGVGISNTKKRLEYLYPDKHSLQLETSNGYFSVQLTIQQ